MSILGTKNGEGLHFVTITPEMFHRYQLVRGSVPRRERGRERLTLRPYEW